MLIKCVSCGHSQYTEKQSNQIRTCQECTSQKFSPVAVLIYELNMILISYFSWLSIKRDINLITYDHQEDEKQTSDLWDEISTFRASSFFKHVVTGLHFLSDIRNISLLC